MVKCKFNFIEVSVAEKSFKYQKVLRFLATSSDVSFFWGKCVAGLKVKQHSPLARVAIQPVFDKRE